MSLICVMSAKGAPGATTTAMLLANLWPRESILVDADPLGGDVALRLPGENGVPLNPDQGLMSLLPAARRGAVAELVGDHTQVAIGGQPVITGMPGPEQSLAVAPLWPQLSQAFAQVPGVDVVADVGQMSSRSPHVSLVETARAVVVVHRPTAWSAVHTRRRLDALSEILVDQGTHVALVAVATPKQEREAALAAERIIGDWEWVTPYGIVALDPKAVVMFEGGTVHRPEKTLLARSGATLARRLHDVVHPERKATVDVPAEPMPSGGADGPEFEVDEAGPEQSSRPGKRRAKVGGDG